MEAFGGQPDQGQFHTDGQARPGSRPQQGGDDHEQGGKAGKGGHMMAQAGDHLVAFGVHGHHAYADVFHLGGGHRIGLEQGAHQKAEPEEEPQEGAKVGRAQSVLGPVQGQPCGDEQQRCQVQHLARDGFQDPP